MNRTDRLFALALELHGDGWTDAGRLARHFGVSVRTVYRDVRALEAAGMPVLSLPGRGFRLLEGTLLSPLQFTPQEAFMLSLGAGTVRGVFDGEYAGAADSALQKLWATLPAELGQEVTRLAEHLRLLPAEQGAEAETLRTLRQAVLERRVTSFIYHKPGASPERRQVYPVRLVHLHGAWLLGGYDPARGGRRSFRLSRIEDLRLLSERFQPDASWLPQHDLWQERLDVTVRLRFPLDLARRVRERPSPFQTEVCETKLGLDVVLQVYEPADALPWVLSWGAGVRVLAPPALADQVREEVRRMGAALSRSS